MAQNPQKILLRVGVSALALACTAAMGTDVAKPAPYAPSATTRAQILAHQAKAAASRHLVTQRQATVAKPVAAVAFGDNGFVNPSRAYPPSCLADNLPTAAEGASSDPNAQQTTLTLPATDSSGDSLTETDTFTVWRQPCSNGQSAVLLEIDRPSSSDNTTAPFFPNIYINNVQYYPRLPNDQNTVYSDTLPDGGMISSNVYVLEYYYGDSANDSNGTPDYNASFALNIDTGLEDNNGNDIVGSLNVAAYSAANFGNYPNAGNPMEISGYMSGPWYDTTHGGEGMLIQIYDNGDQATRTIAATWYTFDNLGNPFWLVAQGTVAIGDTQATNVPVLYETGGGFAGNFTPPLTATNWGTMSFSFSDCNTLNFSYSGASSSNAPNGPAGSGTKQWTRLANGSNIVCQ